MARPDHDPLAGRTDQPDAVPDADIRTPTPADKRRDGGLGLLLIIGLPVLILLAGATMWVSNIGTEGPAVDAPVVVQTPDIEG